jgi:hypothetical protein
MAIAGQPRAGQDHRNTRRVARLLFTVGRPSMAELRFLRARDREVRQLTELCEWLAGTAIVGLITQKIIVRRPESERRRTCAKTRAGEHDRGGVELGQRFQADTVLALRIGNADFRRTGRFGKPGGPA